MPSELKSLLGQLKTLLKAYNKAKCPAEKNLLATRIRQVLTELEPLLTIPQQQIQPVQPCANITLEQLCFQVQEIKAYLQKQNHSAYNKFFKDNHCNEPLVQNGILAQHTLLPGECHLKKLETLECDNCHGDHKDRKHGCDKKAFKGLKEIKKAAKLLQ
jgi:hypothetical protein